MAQTREEECCEHSAAAERRETSKEFDGHLAEEEEGEEEAEEGLLSLAHTTEREKERVDLSLFALRESSIIGFCPLTRRRRLSASPPPPPPPPSSPPTSLAASKSLAKGLSGKETGGRETFFFSPACSTQRGSLLWRRGDQHRPGDRKPVSTGAGARSPSHLPRSHLP